MLELRNELGNSAKLDEMSVLKVKKWKLTCGSVKLSVLFKER